MAPRFPLPCCRRSILAKTPADQVAGRDGAQQVGGEQPTGRGGAHRREPRRVNLSRSGEPENGQASRKPCARYRWYDSGTSSGPVAHDGEGGRCGADLRGVEQLDLLARLLRRRVPLDQRGQHLVDLGRGDPQLAALGHLEDQVEHLPDPLAGERRDIEERHIAEKRRLGNQRFLSLPGGVGVLLLDQIPLVHQHDRARRPAPRPGWRCGGPGCAGRRWRPPPARRPGPARSRARFCSVE